MVFLVEGFEYQRTGIDRHYDRHRAQLSFSLNSGLFVLILHTILFIFNLSPSRQKPLSINHANPI